MDDLGLLGMLARKGVSVAHGAGRRPDAWIVPKWVCTQWEKAALSRDHASVLASTRPKRHRRLKRAFG